MKRKKILTIIKGLIFIFLILTFSGFEFIKGDNCMLSYIRLINSGCLSYMLISIFSNLTNNNIDKKRFSKKLTTINPLWGITFLIINLIQYRTILKVLNLIAIAMIGLSCYELLYKKDKDKQSNKKSESKNNLDIYKFGYLLLLEILLIPLLLILVLKGY